LFAFVGIREVGPHEVTLGASRRKEKEQDLLETCREGATHMPWTPRLLEASRRAFLEPWP